MSKNKKKLSVKVCTGSHCVERKGKKVAKRLEQEIAEAGLDSKLSIKKCDCLGKCKHGPLIRFPQGRLTFENIKPKEVAAVVGQISSVLEKAE